LRIGSLVCSHERGTPDARHAGGLPTRATTSKWSAVSHPDDPAATRASILTYPPQRRLRFAPMSVITKSSRRWTETTIENELRTQIGELGHFPTRAELVARGLRGLWDAMRSTDGVDAWRERLANGPVVATETGNGHDPATSREQIELLAYELYERGAPGSPLDHWLQAERTLV
jgi:hypothetical protein